MAFIAIFCPCRTPYHSPFCAVASPSVALHIKCGPGRDALFSPQPWKKGWELCEKKIRELNLKVKKQRPEAHFSKSSATDILQACSAQPLPDSYRRVHPAACPGFGVRVNTFHPSQVFAFCTFEIGRAGRALGTRYRGIVGAGVEAAFAFLDLIFLSFALLQLEGNEVG
jgi:hypothetical protein